MVDCMTGRHAARFLNTRSTPSPLHQVFERTSIYGKRLSNLAMMTHNSTAVRIHSWRMPLAGEELPVQCIRSESDACNYGLNSNGYNASISRDFAFSPILGWVSWQFSARSKERTKQLRSNLLWRSILRRKEGRRDQSLRRRRRQRPSSYFISPVSNTCDPAKLPPDDVSSVRISREQTKGLA